MNFFRKIGRALKKPFKSSSNSDREGYRGSQHSDSTPTPPHDRPEYESSSYQTAFEREEKRQRDRERQEERRRHAASFKDPHEPEELGEERRNPAEFVEGEDVKTRVDQPDPLTGFQEEDREEHRKEDRGEW